MIFMAYYFHFIVYYFLEYTIPKRLVQVKKKSGTFSVREFRNNLMDIKQYFLVKNYFSLLPSVPPFLLYFILERLA